MFVRYTDEWGSEWVMKKGYTTGEVRKHAIDDWSKWKDYKFPPLPPESHFEGLKARTEGSGHKFYVLGIGGSLQLVGISLNRSYFSDDIFNCRQNFVHPYGSEALNFKGAGKKFSVKG